MNGGSVVGNVVGYDTLNEGFSMYNEGAQVMNLNCEDKMNCNQAPDDIRFGLGYPNAEYRATN